MWVGVEDAVVCVRVCVVACCAMLFVGACAVLCLCCVCRPDVIWCVSWCGAVFVSWCSVVLLLFGGCGCGCCVVAMLL